MFHKGYFTPVWFPHYIEASCHMYFNDVIELLLVDHFLAYNPLIIDYSNCIVNGQVTLIIKLVQIPPVLDDLTDCLDQIESRIVTFTFDFLLILVLLIISAKFDTVV